MGSLFDKKTTTTTKLPAASPEEKQLIAQQLSLAGEQLKNLSTVGDFTSDVFEKLLPELVGQINKFLPQQQQISGQGLDFASQQIGAQGDLLQSELDAIRNGVSLTPEQSALIDQGAQSSIDAGLSDISRFRDESLRTLAQETAIGRGLRPEDTPILDVGGQIANESGRQASQLISQIRAQAAQQKLEYPLAAGQFQANRTQAQQTLGASTLKLIEDLKQQAFTNRINLTSTAGGIGLTAAQIGPNASTLQGLQALRSNSATTTQKSKGNFGDFLSTAASLAAGVGGVMSGVGAIGGLGLASAGATGGGFVNAGGLGLSSL
ncbi:MAG: hypothetical protein AB7I42_26115 [Bradyrhizobium sp.]|uniref:hypothetical protein n=1 Tax=Bradyrhizobium sp. TaxID=376 RepID=UPI003D140A8B